MTAAAGVFRRMEIRPLSARAELGNVVRFSMVVVVAVWMYLATDSATFRDVRTAKQNLLPFQALVQDRPATEQRVFRELQEGLLEAELKRADTGGWPPVAQLAADGIPPFALDPTARDGSYDWRLMSSGIYINYLGLPKKSGGPAWLVLVLEPEPGVPPDAAREDEEHHRLITGEMLHVSTWVRADARIPSRIVRAPQAEGWTQLYAVGSSLARPVAPGAR
jgi:hypothetical protein